MFNIDFETMNDVDIYHLFVKKGNEFNALNGIYPEFFYKQTYIVELAEGIEDKRERAKVAIASGYTSNRIEVLINQKKKGN